MSDKEQELNLMLSDSEEEKDQKVNKDKEDVAMASGDEALDPWNIDAWSHVPSDPFPVEDIEKDPTEPVAGPSGAPAVGLRRVENPNAEPDQVAGPSGPPPAAAGGLHEFSREAILNFLCAILADDPANQDAGLRWQMTEAAIRYWQMARSVNQTKA